MAIEHVSPPEPGKPKNITQVISLVVGALLTVIGLSGILYPAFAGLHLSPLHSLIIAVAGITLFYNGGWKDNSIPAFYSCLGFGIFFGAIAIIGFVYGRPGMPSVGYLRADPQLLVIIPGFQELGRADHILNAVISLVLLGGALDWERRHQQKIKITHHHPRTRNRKPRYGHAH